MFEFREVGVGSIPPDRVGSIVRRNGGLYRNSIKRLLDITLVAISAPIVLPAVGLLALVIRKSGGPVLYAQKRVGRDGEIFTCWKLRTMQVDADSRLQDYLESNPAARFEWERTQKLKKDPRITAFGKFLRKTSLDELPQLWNILTGDMSFVGPRPMMPSQQTMYHGTAYYDMAPGLTGYWQISDRNESTFSARVGFDNRYARELTFVTDLKILFRTIGVVLHGTGY